MPPLVVVPHFRSPAHMASERHDARTVPNSGARTFEPRFTVATRRDVAVSSLQRLRAHIVRRDVVFFGSDFHIAVNGPTPTLSNDVEFRVSALSKKPTPTPARPGLRARQLRHKSPVPHQRDRDSSPTQPRLVQAALVRSCTHSIMKHCWTSSLIRLFLSFSLSLSLFLCSSLPLFLSFSLSVKSCTDLSRAHLLPLFSDLSCAFDHTSNAFALAQVAPKNRVALDMVAERR